MPRNDRTLRVGRLPSWTRVAFLALLMGAEAVGRSIAAPRIPTHDSEVLAEVPAGAAHESRAAQALTRERIDVALPVARVYIERSRDTGHHMKKGRNGLLFRPAGAHRRRFTTSRTIAGAIELRCSALPRMETNERE